MLTMREFMAEVRRIAEAVLTGNQYGPPADQLGAQDASEVEVPEDPDADFLVRARLDLELVELGEAPPDVRQYLAQHILRMVQVRQAEHEIIFMQQRFAGRFPDQTLRDVESAASGDLAAAERVMADMKPRRETVGTRLLFSICEWGSVAACGDHWMRSGASMSSRVLRRGAVVAHAQALLACFKGDAPLAVTAWWDGSRCHLGVSPLGGNQPSDQTAQRRPHLP